MFILEKFFTPCIFQNACVGIIQYLSSIQVLKKTWLYHVYVLQTASTARRGKQTYTFIFSQFKIDKKVLKHSKLHFIFKHY